MDPTVRPPRDGAWGPQLQRMGPTRKRGTHEGGHRKCRKWLEGERAALWPRAPKQGKPRGQSTPAQEELELRAEAYAGEGMLGKATGVFKGERPAAVDAASTADMRAKHPEARGSEAERCARLRPVAAAAAPLSAARGCYQRGSRDFRKGPREGCRGSIPNTSKTP